MTPLLRRVWMLPVAGLFLSSTCLLADDLSGRVLDPDGRPVPNAAVRLFERTTGEARAVRGSSDGAYAFREIPAGDYLLEADASDAALTGSASVSVGGKSSRDLELKVSGRSTEVLVTASSIPLSIQEVAKAIDVVDAGEIALRNELSIAEAVRNLPGVRVQTAEGPGSFTTIQTRGLRSQDTAVLIDGMRFRDASNIQSDATSLLEDMMTVDTDRIEFLRGSGSSLYGSHALGGVINVTSRTGAGPARGSLRVEGGGLGMVRGVASAGGGAFGDKLGYSGSVVHLSLTKGVRDGLPFRNDSRQGMVRYSFGRGMALTGRAWSSSSYLRATESPSLPAPVRANGNAAGVTKAIALPLGELEKYETRQPYDAGSATFVPNAIDPDGRRKGKYLSGTAVFQHQLSPVTAYRVAYQGVDTRRIYSDGPAGPGSFEPAPGARDNFNGYIHTLQARADQRVGKYNLATFGYEMEQERYLGFSGIDAYAPSAAARIDLRQRSHALYFQDQISLFEGTLQITAAGRAQFFSLRSVEFDGFDNPYSGVLPSLAVPTAYTGDGAVAYFVRASGTKLRGHAGNSFRAPSGYERFGGGFGSYYGDPRLSPERAVSVDGGIDQWLFGSRLQVSGTAFYTNLQQTVVFEGSFLPGADPFGRTFGGYANGGGGIARGVEVSAHASPMSRLKVQAAYTYTNSERRAPTVAGTDYYSALDLSPHIFTVTATQWIGRGTNVTVDMAAYSDYIWAISGRRFSFNGPVKADLVVRHDLAFGDERALQLYGKVENILGRRPYENGFFGPKAWFIAGVRASF